MASPEPGDRPRRRPGRWSGRPLPRRLLVVYAGDRCPPRQQLRPMRPARLPVRRRLSFPVSAAPARRWSRPVSHLATSSATFLAALRDFPHCPGSSAPTQLTSSSQPDAMCLRRLPHPPSPQASLLHSMYRQYRHSLTAHRKLPSAYPMFDAEEYPRCAASAWLPATSW